MTIPNQLELAKELRDMYAGNERPDAASVGAIVSTLEAFTWTASPGGESHYPYRALIYWVRLHGDTYIGVLENDRFDGSSVTRPGVRIALDNPSPFRGTEWAGPVPYPEHKRLLSNAQMNALCNALLGSFGHDEGTLQEILEDDKVRWDDMTASDLEEFDLRIFCCSSCGQWLGADERTTDEACEEGDTCEFCWQHDRASEVDAQQLTPSDMSPSEVQP